MLGVFSQSLGAVSQLFGAVSGGDLIRRRRSCAPTDQQTNGRRSSAPPFLVSAWSTNQVNLVIVPVDINAIIVHNAQESKRPIGLAKGRWAN